MHPTQALRGPRNVVKIWTYFWARIAAVPKKGRLALNQRKLVIESMLKVPSCMQSLIDFRKHFWTLISRGTIRKILKKWNEASVIEDQIRGNQIRKTCCNVFSKISVIASSSAAPGSRIFRSRTVRRKKKKPYRT